MSNSNFGLSEVLRVGTESETIEYISPTTNVDVNGFVSCYNLVNFSGSFISSSLIGTSSYTTSGDIYYNQSVSSSNFSGVLVGFSGIVISGSVYGYDILNQQSTYTNDVFYLNRSLVQFDITSISQSISNGSITNPTFSLKLFTALEFELPISFNLYAFPISESWVMGNGYFTDGGSSQGASWDYRDYNGGTTWSMSGSTYIQSISSTQSFNYQMGDISMDVTPIVNSWLNGTFPNNGIVLISGDEFASTGSGMDLKFFSKDTNTIYEPILDVGWSDFYWSTGSVGTSSVVISNIPAGIFGIVSNSGSINDTLYGGFNGVGNISLYNSGSASGLISVTGNSGLIVSMSIYGDFSGSVSSSVYPYFKKCQTCKPEFNAGFNYPGGQDQTQYQGYDIYGWGHAFNEFNQYDWWPYASQQEFGPGCLITQSCINNNTITVNLIMGTLIDGLFSGSTFTSSYWNGYELINGLFSGSWNETMILGTTISASYPLIPFYPNAVNVLFSGSYINGNAFGSITHLSSSYGIFNYGIFNGVFTNGIFVGNNIYVPFTGSILTSSYYYTSSINTTSSVISPVDITKPFATVIQNIPLTVKAGNIIRINIFARPQFPLKNFNRQTQFSQYLVPQYIPTSSYYGIKDNETEQIILNFDENTQISCDQNGNYFLLDTTGFPQERYFKILIKITNGEYIYTIDNNNIFKIIR